MARKTSLRDFQSYLANRLSAAASGAGSASWLALQAGDSRWLVDLAESGEIILAPTVVPVPLTQPWFAGVANIRGNLHAVTDFSAFLGGAPCRINSLSRLLLIGVRYGSNAALLADRMLGLRKPDSFHPAPDDPSLPAWGCQCFTDSDGQRWHKLAVGALLADDRFMHIGR